MTEQPACCRPLAQEETAGSLFPLPCPSTALAADSWTLCSLRNRDAWPSLAIHHGAFSHTEGQCMGNGCSSTLWYSTAYVLYLLVTSHPDFFLTNRLNPPAAAMGYSPSLPLINSQTGCTASALPGVLPASSISLTNLQHCAGMELLCNACPP